MSFSSYPARELEFYRTERQRLNAAGMTDYDEQSAEIARRWLVIQQMTSRPAVMASPVAQSVATPGGVVLPQSDERPVRVPFRLTDQQVRDQGLYFASFESGTYVYKKKPTVLAPAAAAPANQDVKMPFPLSAEQMKRSNLYLDTMEGTLYVYKKMTPALAAARSVDVIDLVADKPTAVVGKKRSRTNLTFISRILHTCRKETLQYICQDLSLTYNGNKIDLIERIMTEENMIEVLLNECRVITLVDICGDHNMVKSGTKASLTARIIRE